MIYNINFGTGKLKKIDATDSDKNNLPIGTVLHLHGYNEPDYVIVSNNGVDPKWSAYGAQYNCINLDTGEELTKQAYTLEWAKDKRPGIGVSITDRIMDDGELKWVKVAAAAQREETARLKKEKADRKTSERASLPEHFPYLKQGTSEVIGAANIRIELKRAFPSIKFTVRAEHRGSSSINIGWTDGPTTEQVKKISDKYQEGNFNGMEDIYEYNHENVWPEVFGGARYVFEQRHESAALILKVGNEMGFKITTGESDNYGVLPGLDHDRSQMIYRKARQTAA